MLIDLAHVQKAAVAPHEDVFVAEREDEPGGGDGWGCAIWWKRLRRAAEVPEDWAQGKTKPLIYSFSFKFTKINRK